MFSWDQLSTIAVGAAGLTVPLAWLIHRYFKAARRKEQEQREQVSKAEKYQLVLEKAKAAEHEDKVFKAQTGHIPSLLSLAKECETNNVSLAVRWYQKAAEQDNEIAQHALARLCKLDPEDPHGEARSKYWEAFIKAKRRDQQALFDLGRYQLRGYGTDINFDSGVENILAAARLDFVPAQLFLGDWYVSEMATQNNPQEAFRWRLRAAINHDAKAFLKLAFCYQTGLGVIKDKTKALYWLERAAEQGNSEAQYLAAKMHLGLTANDAAIAYIWLSLAYAGGLKEAKKERDDVVQVVGITSILDVQSLTKTIYRQMGQDVIPEHSVIKLIDKVYNRKGYRPTEDDLRRLAHDDLLLDGEEFMFENAQQEPAVEHVSIYAKPVSPVSSAGYQAESATSPIAVSTPSQAEFETSVEGEAMTFDGAEQNTQVLSESLDDASRESPEKSPKSSQQYQTMNWSTSWDSMNNSLEESVQSSNGER